MNYSTRYDDRNLIPGKTRNSRLDWLEQKLHNEIMLCSESIMKLERLAERYWVDGLAAASEQNFAYRFRYIQAYEHIQILLENGYKKLPKVL